MNMLRTTFFVLTLGVLVSVAGAAPGDTGTESGQKAGCCKAHADAGQDSHGKSGEKTNCKDHAACCKTDAEGNRTCAKGHDKSGEGHCTKTDAGRCTKKAD
jgi:hypothetical protein